MLANSLAAVIAAFKFRGYRPRRITPWVVYRWIDQYAKIHHRALRTLLKEIQYISEHKMMESLAAQNLSLLQELRMNGVSPDNVIYVSVHDTASSSSVLLGLLRDRCLLAQLGCHFVEGRNRIALHEITRKLGRGAIIYIDDFAGSGDQFCDERDVLSPIIVGNFSEHFLVHTICEEALTRIAKSTTYSVEPAPCLIHARSARPLHSRGNMLPTIDKRAIRDLCRIVSSDLPLGHRSLAANIVFYRSAPDAIPRIFRGNEGQDKFVGIFPRLDDLPIPVV